MSEIVGNARLELLRSLAWYRDWHEQWTREKNDDPNFCRLVPLEESYDDYQNDFADILLAARECAALGEIEMSQPRAGYPMIDGRHYCAITVSGYARIRAHDTLGEVTQDGAA